MLEFMQVPGFIVYRNRIVDTPHGADLTRDPIAEVEDECTAQVIVAKEKAKDPTAPDYWIYYEEGTILV